MCNLYLQECNVLKAEKAELQEQLQRVQQQKEHFEFILQAHEALCKVKLMAPEVGAASVLLANYDALQPQAAAALAVSAGAAKRPSSLLLAPQVDNHLPLKKRV